MGSMTLFTREINFIKWKTGFKKVWPKQIELYATEQKYP